MTELDEMLAHHNAKVDRLNRGYETADCVFQVVENITATIREYRESNKNRQAFRKKYNRRPQNRQKKMAFMIKMQATGYMAAARLSAMLSQPIPKYPAGVHSEFAVAGESGPELIDRNGLKRVMLASRYGVQSRLADMIYLNKFSMPQNIKNENSTDHSDYE